MSRNESAEDIPSVIAPENSCSRAPRAQPGRPHLNSLCSLRVSDKSDLGAVGPSRKEKKKATQRKVRQRWLNEAASASGTESVNQAGDEKEEKKKKTKNCKKTKMKIKEYEKEGEKKRRNMPTAVGELCVESVFLRSIVDPCTNCLLRKSVY